MAEAEGPGEGVSVGPQVCAPTEGNAGLVVWQSLTSNQMVTAPLVNGVASDKRLRFKLPGTATTAGYDDLAGTPSCDQAVMGWVSGDASHSAWFRDSRWGKPHQLADTVAVGNEVSAGVSPNGDVALVTWGETHYRSGTNGVYASWGQNGEWGDSMAVEEDLGYPYPVGTAVGSSPLGQVVYSTMTIEGDLRISNFE